MKTASVREIRQNFGQLLDWINAGEEVTVTMHRRPVARILPLGGGKKKKKIKWPDFAARQKAMFGDKVFPDIVAEEREGYRW